MYNISFKYYISGVKKRYFGFKDFPFKSRPTDNCRWFNNGVRERGRWRVINYIAYVYMCIEIIVGAASKNIMYAGVERFFIASLCEQSCGSLKSSVHFFFTFL